MYLCIYIMCVYMFIYVEHVSMLVPYVYVCMYVCVYVYIHIYILDTWQLYAESESESYQDIFTNSTCRRRIGMLAMHTHIHMQAYIPSRHSESES